MNGGEESKDILKANAQERVPLKKEFARSSAARDSHEDATDAAASNMATDTAAPNMATDAAASPMIHILGIGSIGKLIAHSLGGIPVPPPITLIFYRWDYAVDWQRSGQQISLTTDKFTVARSGYQWEVSEPTRLSHGKSITPDQNRHEYVEPDLPRQGLQTEGEANLTPKERRDLKRMQEDEKRNSGWSGRKTMIHNLIVTVKAHQTVGALLSLRHRLTRNSTILFVQNGMGIVEEVNDKVFPDPETRPKYMLGVTTHGVRTESIWHATHRGSGIITIGSLDPRVDPSISTPNYASRNNSTTPDNNEPDPSLEPTSLPTTTITTTDVPELATPPASRYLLRTILRCPALCAVPVGPTELLKVQLEKLAINCVINPLTVMLDCRNGSLLYNYYVTRTLRLLLSEISLVIRSLPELKGLPGMNWRFAPERLETVIVSVADNTRHNISSMLADVRTGKQTEAQFLNGYVVKRGEELGIACVVNYAMMQMVRAKSMMIKKEMDTGLPVIDSLQLRAREERRVGDSSVGDVD